MFKRALLFTLGYTSPVCRKLLEKSGNLMRTGKWLRCAKHLSWCSQQQHD